MPLDIDNTFALVDMGDVKKASDIMPSVLSDIFDQLPADNAVVVGRCKKDSVIHVHQARQVGLHASLDLSHEYNVIDLARLLVCLYNTVGNNPPFPHVIYQQDREVRILQHQIPSVLKSLEALADAGPLPYSAYVHTPAYPPKDVSLN